MPSQLDSWLIWLAGSHVTIEGEGGRGDTLGLFHPQNRTCLHRKYGLLLSNVVIWVGAGLESLSVHPTRVKSDHEASHNEHDGVDRK